MKVLIGLVLTLLSLTALAQEKTSVLKIQTTKIDSSQPMFIVDGIPTSQAEFNLINPDNIAKMEVIQKNDAVLLYGEQGRNGAVVITTKRRQVPKSVNRR